uniref:Uncharacterized protein n=1 Tax=Trichuris muris TaxID=70415 RepID=A0A5S6QKR5_TRIMR
MDSREERLRKYVAELESFSNKLSAREKSLLNHGVLSSLATALLDKTVFEIARELQEIQQIKEKDLFQQRQAMISEQARAKERLLERQQQEVVQCQSLPDHVTVAVIEKNHRERQRFETSCLLQLQRLDKEAVEELDQYVTQQQTILEKAGVPGFCTTRDTRSIRFQMVVLKLIMHLAMYERHSSSADH